MLNLFKGNKMNSHVLIPKCVLRCFVDDNVNKVYCYENKENYIRSTSPKSINTERDYFSKECEKFLNNNIETKLGRVLKYLKEQKAGIFKMDVRYYEVILLYARSLVFRSKLFKNNLQAKGVFDGGFSEQEKNDISIALGYKESNEMQLFSEKHMGFIYAGENAEFVLPSKGYIYCDVVDNSIGFLVFLTRKYACLFSESVNMKFSVINASKDTIASINQRSFLSSSLYSDDFVVSSKKELLETLKKNFGAEQEK